MVGPGPCRESYLARLIRGGFRVAIAEQLKPAEARKARGRRRWWNEHRPLVTPGTLTEETCLDSGRPMVAAVARAGDDWASRAARYFDREARVVAVAPANCRPSLLAYRRPKQSPRNKSRESPPAMARAGSTASQASERSRSASASPPLMASGLPAEPNWRRLGACWPISTQPRKRLPPFSPRRAACRAPSIWRSTRRPVTAWKSAAPRQGASPAACWLHRSLRYPLGRRCGRRLRRRAGVGNERGWRW